MDKFEKSIKDTGAVVNAICWFSQSLINAVDNDMRLKGTEADAKEALLEHFGDLLITFGHKSMGNLKDYCRFFERVAAAAEVVMHGGSQAGDVGPIGGGGDPAMN